MFIKHFKLQAISACLAVASGGRIAKVFLEWWQCILFCLTGDLQCLMQLLVRDKFVNTKKLETNIILDICNTYMQSDSSESSFDAMFFSVSPQGREVSS